MMTDLIAECEQWHEVAKKQRERIAELEDALDNLLMALDLPGNHCEVDQAKRHTQEILARGSKNRIR